MGMGLLGLIAVIVIVLGLGGGGFYLLWLKTRPKKETWTAKVYHLSESIRDPTRNKKGEVISKLSLNDIKPYAFDILEKIERKNQTVYRLQKLNKPTPPVEGDVIEYWGKGRKEVAVLIDKGNCSLMKKGYDKVTGDLVFEPMPISRINLMKSEMALRKDRQQANKDILQAITPWIVTGICMMSIIGIAYITITGYIEISENLNQKIPTPTTTVTKPPVQNLGKQEPTPEVPMIDGGGT